MQLFPHFFDFLILNMFTNRLWTGVWTNFTDVPCPIPWGGVVTHCEELFPRIADYRSSIIAMI